MARFFFFIASMSCIAAVVIYWENSRKPFDQKLQEVAEEQYSQTTKGLHKDLAAGKLSLEEAAKRNQAAKVDLAYEKNIISNQADVCGVPFKHNDDWSQVTIDVSACKGGEHFPIRFGNVYVSERCEAKAYFYGHGQPIDELEKFVGKQLVNPFEVDWRVLHEDKPDGFSEVTTVGPYLHERRGDTKIVYGGKGDLLALIKVHSRTSE